jgi:hypothetical protein
MKLGTTCAWEILDGEKADRVAITEERHRKSGDAGKTFGKMVHILHCHITTKRSKPRVEIFDIGF